MAQTKKTPQYLVEAILAHSRIVQHCEEMIRVKTTHPFENQADHVRFRSVEQMIAYVDGASGLLESTLMAYGCYVGFYHVGHFKTDGSCEGVDPQHPEFRYWAKVYWVNSGK